MRAVFRHLLLRLPVFRGFPVLRLLCLLLPVFLLLPVLRTAVRLLRSRPTGTTSLISLISRLTSLISRPISRLISRLSSRLISRLISRPLLGAGAWAEVQAAAPPEGEVL